MKIYIADINDFTIEYLEASVSEVRRQSATRFRFNEDKKRSMLAAYLLDRALNDRKLTELIPAEPIVDENEKPHLYDNDGNEIYFSLSHSGDYAACAIADSGVGVDIEECKEYLEQIANRFFGESEKKLVNDKESFYRIWTLKEALMKAVGLGMSLPMNSFSVVPWQVGNRYYSDIDEHFIKAVFSYEIDITSLGDKLEYVSDKDRMFGITGKYKDYALSVCAVDYKELLRTEVIEVSV